MTKRRRYPNVSGFTDRHGKLRWRWRKSGFPTYYFRNPPDTPGFRDELAACEAGDRLKAGAGRCVPRSINDLVARYYGSADFNSGGAADQHRRRLLIESFRAEFGDDLVEHFGFEHIEAILLKRSRKRVEGGRPVGGKVAAQNLRKQLRRLFAYAKRLQWIRANPVEDATKIKADQTGGYHTWTEAEIAQYQRRHPLGTKARLALEIFLWTAQRRGDASTFGRKHLKGGKVNFRAGKTGRELWQPAAPQLLEAIAAMPVTGTETFLVTDYGKPFTRAGLGNKMREWCDEAGLPHCTAHGVRKAVARRLAEGGATQVQIKAVGGWRGDAEVATYTAAAEQAQLADVALGRLAQQDLANRESRLANPTPEGSENA
jgi:integrase